MTSIPASPCSCSYLTLPVQLVWFGLLVCCLLCFTLLALAVAVPGKLTTVLYCTVLYICTIHKQLQKLLLLLLLPR